jgi:transcriptional regulator GlxA family with amidase domain
MRDVVQFIDRHYAKPLTVAALARRARLSRFHFIRAFRAYTGATPHQYLRARRIDRARHLLGTTPMPITEICHGVGFRSLGSFSSLFHRSVGQSPSAFRASTHRSPYIPGCFVRMYRMGR